VKKFNTPEDFLFESFSVGEKIKYQDKIYQVKRYTRENLVSELTLDNPDGTETITLKVGEPSTFTDKEDNGEQV